MFVILQDTQIWLIASFFSAKSFDIYIFLYGFLLLIGFLIGFFTRKKIVESKVNASKLKSANILSEAKIQAESAKKEILLEAKEESLKIKNEVERELNQRRNDLQRLERRLQSKEETLERKNDSFEKKEELLQKRNCEIDTLKSELETLYKKQFEELEKISGFTADQAKVILLNNIENEVRIESAKLIKDLELKAKQEADKKAREIISIAIQRCAVDHVAETTVSVVSLPNDEMKGRIIGREGRNIRTIEALTGVDLIIDDTPEAVILSGFDPMRREIARIALEKLIADGRVHPARIEEMVEKAKKEVEVIIKEDGEAAIFELGIHGMHPELVRLLGKMRFRTSYGQNMLRHSIEVAHLAGMIAAELGVDVNIAKRAGLLHDIGKSVDHDMEGSHVSIGISLCKKYRESNIIINTIESHHGDVEADNIYSVIAQSADAISAARPGSRRETLESYIKRLQNLESIAESFKGVEKSFAIQAGRELRIIVVPDEVDDPGLVLLARDISKKVEEELEYPGQIKVSLIRETRAVEYAK